MEQILERLHVFGEQSDISYSLPHPDKMVSLCLAEARSVVSEYRFSTISAKIDR